MLTWKEQAVYATQWFGSKYSPEVWEMKHNLQLIMVPFKTKGLQSNVCLLQPVTTLSLSRYTLHTKQLITHNPEEQSRKNKLCIIAITSLLAVGTQSHINMDNGSFSVKG
jgi:hypothetical protein